MTPETLAKRSQLSHFIARKLAPFVAVKGVVAIGSVGMGTAHAESDLDLVVFLDPFDLYIVPAEALWHEADDTYYSIFVEDEAIQAQGYQVDALRLDWQQWRDPASDWPEERRSELGSGWIAYDPTGEVARVIAEKTIYDDAMRQKRLDEAINWLDQHLGWGGPEKRWTMLSPVEAHDRLHATYYYLIQALFAYNRRWRTWRNREMTAVLQLPWLPPEFAERSLTLLNSPSHDEAGYKTRANALQAAFDALLKQVQADGLYGDDPISQAFIRHSEEPGRAWNMAAWREEHQRRFPPAE